MGKLTNKNTPYLCIHIYMDMYMHICGNVQLVRDKGNMMTCIIQVLRSKYNSDDFKDLTYPKELVNRLEARKSQLETELENLNKRES